MAAERLARDDLVTLTIAAQLFKVTRHTVLRWIHTGQIEAARQPSGQWRVSRAHIQEFQATRRYTWHDLG